MGFLGWFEGGFGRNSERFGWDLGRIQGNSKNLMSSG